MGLAKQFIEATKHNGFYNIMPISNLPSVMAHGILSNEKVKSINHSSVAMPEIQERRDLVEVPNGLKLHQYANLYFDARNPMMYKRQNEDICVIKVKADVLDIPDVVIADQNASSKYACFMTPEMALIFLKYDRIYAEDWRDDDLIAYMRKKSYKCAEVLVPHHIPSEYIEAIAVKNESDKAKVEQLVPSNMIVCVKPHIFFKD